MNCLNYSCKDYSWPVCITVYVDKKNEYHNLIIMNAKCSLSNIFTVRNMWRIQNVVVVKGNTPYEARSYVVRGGGVGWALRRRLAQLTMSTIGEK